MPTAGSVLIIDEDVATVDVITDVLNDEGYRAFGVASDTVVHIAAVQPPPAVILLDVRRRDTIAIARVAACAAIPIVLMTTASGSGVGALLTMPGVVACLSKPFVIDDLLAYVACYVQPSQA